MLPGAESMGAPSSFTARRPNASHLPQFELPPPQLPAFQKYQQPYSSSNNHVHPPAPSSLASVGNLLTPPSASSIDGVGPVSAASITTGGSASTQAMAPYTPTGYSWSQTGSGSTPYGFQSSMSPATFAPPRGPFTPSLNTLGKGNSSPSVSELPHPPYGEAQTYSTSMPMSAPNSLPSLPSHQSYGSMASATPASAAHARDAYSRHPPTSSYYNGTHQSSTPAATPYPYSAGPSPIQQSPVSAGGALNRMSPANGHSQMPPLASQHTQSPYAQQRPYSYSLPGPVLSNINSSNSQIGLVGGMHAGIMSGYNSGHAAHLSGLYGHAPPQPAAINERPFKCDQCPQSFNRNHDLKRHKRIHLAVKPFPCGYCDKSFSRKDALKRHILVKGCGKAQPSGGDRDKSSEGSVSPRNKIEPIGSSPVVAASA